MDGNFTDSSASGHTVTASGNAQASTSQKKFGTGSAYFDGSGDYLTIPSSSDWDFGTGDFTIELWAKADSVVSNQNFISRKHPGCDTSSWYFRLEDPSQVTFADGGCTQHLFSHAFGTSEFKHVAAVRSSGTTTIYMNGTSIGSFSDSTNYTTQGDIVIGARRAAGNIIQFFDGYIDEVRVSKGIARWTANFTPPASVYSAGSTQLYFIDSSGKEYTVNLTPAPSCTDKIKNGDETFVDCGGSCAKVCGGVTFTDATNVLVNGNRVAHIPGTGAGSAKSIEQIYGGDGYFEFKTELGIVWAGLGTGTWQKKYCGEDTQAAFYAYKTGAGGSTQPHEHELGGACSSFGNLPDALPPGTLWRLAIEDGVYKLYRNGTEVPSGGIYTKPIYPVGLRLNDLGNSGGAETKVYDVIKYPFTTANILGAAAWTTRPSITVGDGTISCPSSSNLGTIRTKVGITGDFAAYFTIDLVGGDTNWGVAAAEDLSKVQEASSNAGYEDATTWLEVRFRFVPCGWY
jgi:hypothetical protein